jgi:transposase
LQGASNYTYAEASAEASWTQNLWDWIHSHVRAYEFFAGTSRLVVSGNLKPGVKASCYCEPELNRTYGDLAIHYGVGILPARPYRPCDKAKAEVGVQIVQRRVLAALRRRQFFSLGELNKAILDLVYMLNQRPFSQARRFASRIVSDDRSSGAAAVAAAIAISGTEHLLGPGHPRVWSLSRVGALYRGPTIELEISQQ